MRRLRPLALWWDRWSCDGVTDDLMRRPTEGTKNKRARLACSSSELSLKEKNVGPSQVL